MVPFVVGTVKLYRSMETAKAGITKESTLLLNTDRVAGELETC